MPELEDLLAAEAARYDIRQPPVSLIRHRRQRRVLARIGGALAAGAVLGAGGLLLPSLGQERDAVVANRPADRPEGGPRIQGLRTDANGLGLIAAYICGLCDGPASLVVEERGDRVDVAVRVLPRPGDDENTICPAAGIGRTVTADLSEPLGDRPVRADGKPIEPYDGADLVIPRRLPDGFVLRSETGAVDGDSWAQTYGPPSADGLGGPCDPGQRSLGLSTGPCVLEAFSAPHFRDDGPVKAGEGDARLYSQGGGAVRYLALRVGGQPVTLSYSADCGGTAPSVAELVEIADGLVPAGP